MVDEPSFQHPSERARSIQRKRPGDGAADGGIPPAVPHQTFDIIEDASCPGPYILHCCLQGQMQSIYVEIELSETLGVLVLAKGVHILKPFRWRFIHASYYLSFPSSCPGAHVNLFPDNLLTKLQTEPAGLSTNSRYRLQRSHSPGVYQGGSHWPQLGLRRNLAQSVV